MNKAAASIISDFFIVVFGLSCLLAPIGCGTREEERAWNESDLIKMYISPYSRTELMVTQSLDDSVRSFDGVLLDKVERSKDGSYFGYARRYTTSSRGDVFLGSVDVRLSRGNADIAFTLYPIIESGPRAGKMVNSNDIREISMQWESESKVVSRIIKKSD